MAAGDFSASAISEVKKMVSDFWDDPRTNLDPITSIETFRAIAENQSINARPLSDASDCTNVSVVFLDNCGNTTASCSSDEDCEITGTEMESAKATYAPTICRRYSFTVWDDDCNGMISFQEKYAKGLRDGMMALEYDLDKAALSYLDANASANVYTDGIGDIVGDETYYAPSLWTADLIAELALTARMNYIENPAFVTATNLWAERFNAQYNFQNSNEKDQWLKLNHFPRWYFDLEGIRDLTLGKATYAFDPRHVAFFNKNAYANEVPLQHTDALNTVTYRIRSPRAMWRNNGVMVPVFFDVETQVECKPTGFGKRFGRKTRLTVHGGIIGSPAPCNESTGILKFLNGEAPEPEPEEPEIP